MSFATTKGFRNSAASYAGRMPIERIARSELCSPHARGCAGASRESAPRATSARHRVDRPAATCRAWPCSGRRGASTPCKVRRTTSAPSFSSRRLRVIIMRMQITFVGSFIIKPIVLVLHERFRTLVRILLSRDRAARWEGAHDGTMPADPRGRSVNSPARRRSTSAATSFNVDRTRASRS